MDLTAQVHTQSKEFRGRLVFGSGVMISGNTGVVFRVEYPWVRGRCCNSAAQPGVARRPPNRWFDRHQPARSNDVLGNPAATVRIIDPPESNVVILKRQKFSSSNGQ